jgi:hypothetical protein
MKLSTTALSNACTKMDVYAGVAVDYGFVKSIYANKKAVAIARPRKNHIIISHPTVMMYKDAQNHALTVVESYIQYSNILAQTTIQSAGGPPNLTPVSMYMLSSGVSNMTITHNTTVPYIGIDCLSERPLHDMMVCLSSMFLNTPMYYSYEDKIIKFANGIGLHI